MVVIKICKKEVYDSQTRWKEDNFKRRTVINMSKHISNGSNLKFLLFIQSVCRNFKIYSHNLFLRKLFGRYLGTWRFSCERRIRMRVDLEISDHWKVENHKAKVDAIEACLQTENQWWNEIQCIKSYSEILLKHLKKNIKQRKKCIRLIKKMWSFNKI